jgi:hypothetical protein
VALSAAPSNPKKEERHASCVLLERDIDQHEPSGLLSPRENFTSPVASYRAWLAGEQQSAVLTFRKSEDSGEHMVEFGITSNQRLMANAGSSHGHKDDRVSGE